MATAHSYILLVHIALILSGSTATAQTFIGPGPDPACDGTELKIVQTKGRVTFIQQTIFASTRTLVEQYKPLGNGVWQVTLLLYSSRHHYGEAMTRNRLLRSSTFKATDTAKAARMKEAFGYGDIVWSDEPQRLLTYFRENREWFEQMKE